MNLRFDNAEPNLARRYDDLAGELLPATTRGTDGALLAEGPAVHEGVLVYPQASGPDRLELVTLDAVNDTVRTIPYAPLTLGHPKEGMVTLDTSERLSVGGVGGEPKTVMEEAVGGFAKVMVIIRSDAAVKAFNSGTRKLSCGYEVTLDETPGTHPIFGRYDARQIGRNVNHLALVDDGRDDRAFLRADSSDATGTYAPPKPAGTPRTDKGSTMNPLLTALLARLTVFRSDSEDSALAEAGVKLDALLTERDDLKLKVDQFPPPEEENEDAPNLIEELAAAKKEIEVLKAAAAKKDEEEEEMKADAAFKTLQALATEHDVKHDGLDLDELRLKLAKTRGDSVTAEMSAEALDAIIGTIPAKKPARSDGGSRWNQSDKTGNRADGDADGGGTPDVSDPKSLWFNPSLSRADAARQGAS